MAIAVIACRQANGAGWGAGHNTDSTLKAQRTHARRWNLNLRSMDWSKEISNSFAVSRSAVCSLRYGFGPAPLRVMLVSLKFGFWPAGGALSRPSRENLSSVDGPDTSVRIRPPAGAPSRPQRARASRGRAQVPRGAFAAPPWPSRAPF